MGWDAKCTISRLDDGNTHVTVWIDDAASKNEAFEAAVAILERLSGGSKTIIREPPIGCSVMTSNRGMPTEIVHKGFVRFSFEDQVGGVLTYKWDGLQNKLEAVYLHELTNIG